MLLIGAAGVGDSLTFDLVGSHAGAMILAVLMGAGGIVCWGYGRGLEIEQYEKAQLRRYCRKLKNCRRAENLSATPSADGGAAGSSPIRGNGDDRRQRRKQEGAVGAAASGMQAEAQQTLGAATRAQSAKNRGRHSA